MEYYSKASYVCFSLGSNFKTQPIYGFFTSPSSSIPHSVPGNHNSKVFAQYILLIIFFVNLTFLLFGILMLTYIEMEGKALVANSECLSPSDGNNDNLLIYLNLLG